jgi:uncharacterized protein YwlG (UPF0340 family)
MKNLGIAFLLAVLGASGAFLFIYLKSDSSQCEKHQIAKAECPFCDKSLIEKMGKCKEHGGIPEALCYQCNKHLKKAFEIEGDWCGGHNVPESQCEKCNPSGGSEKKGCLEHQTGENPCPFCNKALVTSMGKCKEHGGIPEALCYQCNKHLKKAFQIEKDWCVEHEVPESQCKKCNKDK